MGRTVRPVPGPSRTPLGEILKSAPSSTPETYPGSTESLPSLSCEAKVSTSIPRSLKNPPRPRDNQTPSYPPHKAHPLTTTTTQESPSTTTPSLPPPGLLTPTQPSTPVTYQAPLPSTTPTILASPPPRQPYPHIAFLRQISHALHHLPPTHPARSRLHHKYLLTNALLAHVHAFQAFLYGPDSAAGNPSFRTVLPALRARHGGAVTALSDAQIEERLWLRYLAGLEGVAGVYSRRVREGLVRAGREVEGGAGVEVGEVGVEASGEGAAGEEDGDRVAETGGGVEMEVEVEVEAGTGNGHRPVGDADVGCVEVSGVSTGEGVVDGAAETGSEGRRVAQTETETETEMETVQARIRSNWGRVCEEERCAGCDEVGCVGHMQGMLIGS